MKNHPPRGIKVTIEIPDALWVRTKRRALDERTSFRALVLDGLELRLGTPKQGKGGAR